MTQTPAIPVTFYVQAGAAIGIGHLERSTVLARELARAGLQAQFRLVADALGRDEAAARKIHDAAPGRKGGRAVVIDAVTIPASDARWISRFDKRILISPVCDRADLATHVLVRRAPEKLRSALSAGALLIEDPTFAFVTSSHLSPRALDFERLTVGICLSGSREGPDLPLLVHAVAKIPTVSAIHVLSRARPPSLPQGAPRLVWQTPDRAPWTFLADVNVFIGGQGLMLAEAAAQGLPVISLAQPDRDSRNRDLVELRCVTEIRRSPLDEAALQKLLADRAALMAMHQAAFKNLPRNCAGAMAERLHSILTM